MVKSKTIKKIAEELEIERDFDLCLVFIRSEKWQNIYLRLIN